MTFESYGVVIGVRTTSPAILPELEKLLPPGSKRLRSKRVSILYSLLVPASGRPGLKRFNVLFLGAMRVSRSLEQAEVLEVLREGILEMVASFSRESLFVRGGVVEKDGRAIVLAGPKGSGTSTLARAFLRAGANSHSDEYALFDKAGRALSFRVSKPGAGAVPGSAPTGSRDAPAPGGSSGRDTPRAIPLGIILSTSFRDGARFQPKVLTPGEAILALLSNTSPVRFRARTTITRLSRVVRAAAALKGVRGEADEVVARILGSPEWTGARGRTMGKEDPVETSSRKP